eukprot:12562051-Heterocapsa_arctica.AAC.1
MSQGKGARARSQSVGRGWRMEDQLMQAVASQLASNLQSQFGSGHVMGGQGRRGKCSKGRDSRLSHQASRGTESCQRTGGAFADTRTGGSGISATFAQARRRT